jgi:hypothetical protein
MVALALAPIRSGSLPRCRYQEQASPQTLAEGLAEYYGRNRERVLPPQSLPPDSAALFRSHDICHVIFGLDTTLADEAMADVRTLLSCDVGWGRYAKYMVSDPEAKAIFKQVGYLNAFWITVRTIPRTLRAVAEAWRAPNRWPWEPPESFFERPLCDLRQEFRIRVL